MLSVDSVVGCIEIFVLVVISVEALIECLHLISQEVRLPTEMVGHWLLGLRV